MKFFSGAATILRKQHAYSVDMTQQKKPPSKQTVGDRVRELRQEKKLTQRMLAEKVGLSAAAIGRMESERDYVTSKPTITALAQALGCDSTWLETGEIQPPKEKSLAEALSTLPEMFGSMLMAGVKQIRPNITGGKEPNELPRGNELEENTQITVVVALLCQKMTSRQLMEAIQDVLKNVKMNERSKVFWVKMLGNWAVAKMETEDFEQLPANRKIASRRSQNDLRKSDPKSHLQTG
ncbi:MAG: helix-turn-helix transcriptional regulator [Nibricoccus sp.]